MKIGDEVVVVYCWRAFTRTNIEEYFRNTSNVIGVVSKIGRKYITVLYHGFEYQFYQHKNSIFYDGKHSEYRMYLSMDDVEKQFAYEELKRRVRNFDVTRLSYESLQKVWKIIEEEYQ